MFYTFLNKQRIVSRMMMIIDPIQADLTVVWLSPQPFSPPLVVSPLPILGNEPSEDNQLPSPYNRNPKVLLWLRPLLLRTK